MEKKEQKGIASMKRTDLEVALLTLIATVCALFAELALAF
jgi:hypothetical protein